MRDLRGSRSRRARQRSRRHAVGTIAPDSGATLRGRSAHHLPLMTVDLIVNPASGPAGHVVSREGRLRFVSELLRTAGVREIRPTQTARTGDASRATHAAVALGTDLVLVWGGDGTVNEVAGVLVGRQAPLGIVPGGSGNGLARGLGLPLGVEEAVQVALRGRRRAIDTGQVAGRTFLNLAGVGFDAAVAARVNTANVTRGLRPYVLGVLHEWRSPTHVFTLSMDDRPTCQVEAHLIVVCNGQQYGHGARVAPQASFEDGWLDVVAIPRITARRLLWHGWWLFDGSLPRVPGVITARARRIVVSHDAPLPAHLDGEVVSPDTTRTFEVRPQSLIVKSGF